MAAENQQASQGLTLLYPFTRCFVRIPPPRNVRAGARLTRNSVLQARLS